MGGAAGSGFLQGFTQTSLALAKLKHERDREEQELALKKQDLALRRDILKGQEASRALQDRQNQLSIQKLQTELERQAAAANLLSDAQAPAAVPQGATPGIAPALPQATPTPEPALPDPGAFSQPIQVLPGTPNGTQAPAIVDPSLPDRAQPFNTPEYRAYLEKIGRGEDPGPPPRGATVVGRTSPQSAPAATQPAVPLPDAGVRVTAPRATPEALARQPVGVADTPELTEMNRRIQALDVLEQNIHARLAAQPLLRAEPSVQKTLTDLRTNRTELLKQRTELVKEQSPANVFTAMLKRNQGDLDATIAEYRAFEVEKMRENQAIGLSNVAQKTSEAEEAKRKAEQQFKESQTLLDVKSQESRQFFDVRTGNPLPQSSRYRQVLERVDRGEVVFLDDQEAKSYRDIQRMVPLLNQIKEQIAAVYGPGGIFENLPSEQRLAASVKGGLARLTQSNPKLAEADRVIKGNVDNLRRSLQGQVGTQTEQDAQRGLQVLPQVTGVPDSKEVAYSLYNTLLETVNGMLGTYLGKPEFQHQKLAPLSDTPARRVLGAPVPVPGP